MFITAKVALVNAGGSGRQMPFKALVQYQRREGGVWHDSALGYSIEYLADSYNDQRVLWPHARIINPDTGEVIFSG